MVQSANTTDCLSFLFGSHCYYFYLKTRTGLQRQENMREGEVPREMEQERKTAILCKR